MAEKTVNRFFPTEAETVRLIRESQGRVLTMAFGPSGAWIEWPEGEPEPWAVTKCKEYRGVPLVGCNGDGI
jgi:hypothetical protein